MCMSVALILILVFICPFVRPSVCLCILVDKQMPPILPCLFLHFAVDSSLCALHKHAR